MSTIVLAGWLMGCGEPEPLRSTPASPTVTFEQSVGPQDILWTDLQELLPQRPAALPELLSGLRPGMAGAEAREVLMAAHQPGVRVFSQPVGERFAVASMLKGYPSVGVTLILDDEGQQLSAVDLSLPDEVAVPLLINRWGDPAGSTMQDGGKARYRWEVEGEPWSVELWPAEKAGDKAVLKFSPKG